MIILLTRKHGIELFILIGNTTQTFFSINAAYVAAQCFAVSRS